MEDGKAYRTPGCGSKGDPGGLQMIWEFEKGPGRLKLQRLGGSQSYWYGKLKAWWKNGCDQAVHMPLRIQHSEEEGTIPATIEGIQAGLTLFVDGSADCLDRSSDMRSSTRPLEATASWSSGEGEEALQLLKALELGPQLCQAQSALALLAFSAVLAFVLQEQWAVPDVQPTSAAGFSAERTRGVLTDLVGCGPKYVGFKSNEVCALEALRHEINRTVSEEGAAARILIDQQSASGHYYLDTWHHVAFFKIWEPQMNQPEMLDGNTAIFLQLGTLNSNLGCGSESSGLTITYRNLTNLLVKLPAAAPGDPSGCALLISSHFDSALGSPAASDANAEMAIMTDLLRLMIRRPMPIDVIFNFNGGEEAGWQEVPAGNEIRISLTLSSGGRELLFQAGPSNRWIAEAYKSHVKRPYGSSITQALFHTGLIPGETDFRIYRDFGEIPGADFAVLTNGWVYHTWRDDMDHLDFRSVQRYGETVHELALGIASKLKEGRPSGADVTDAAVFFDVGGLFFVEPRVVRAAASCTICCLDKWIGCFHLLGVAEVEKGSIALAALICLALSASPITVMASYLFLIWCVAPALALVVASILPSAAELLMVGSYILPWMLYVQMLVLGLDFLSPLTFRSGTTIPGDVVIGGFYGLMMLGFLGFWPGVWRISQQYATRHRTALLLSLSAQFVVQIRRRDVIVVSAAIFFLSLLLAFQLFPYSYDRPKRVFQQHVARSQATWQLLPQGRCAWLGLNFSWLNGLGQSSVQWQDMEHGLWTTAMDAWPGVEDWNNVATLRHFSPYGLPAGSQPHNDSAGVYGQAFLVGGSWAPRSAPVLPSKISLDLRVAEWTPGMRQLLVTAKGPPQMMMVLSPASKVVQWSYGRYDRSSDAAEAKHSNDPKMLPRGLPRPRSDCDCFFLLFAEGGSQPSYGRSEAFNFTALVPPGEMHLDIWALHLESTSPELEYEEERSPSWISYMGWVSELQAHKIIL
eukprot:s212_g15.t1